MKLALLYGLLGRDWNPFTAGGVDELAGHVGPLHESRMSVRSLFVTKLYEADLGTGDLLSELAHSIRALATDDAAGQRWSDEHRYAGYTSYASLNDLPRRDKEFAKDCAFDLGRKPKLDSLWVNLLRGSGHHSAHIHPHSILSGTLYVEVPSGSGAIRFEDPRLPLKMAAPKRDPDASDAMQTFVTVEPRPGLLLLWESWLRHEVMPGRGRGERLSISFNFA